MTKNVEHQAEVILHPGIIKVKVDCDCCRVAGTAWAYAIFFESLTKAKFYCEDCRITKPRGLNIDTTNCPELTNRVVFPTGLISWHTLENKD